MATTGERHAHEAWTGDRFRWPDDPSPRTGMAPGLGAAVVLGLVAAGAGTLAPVVGAPVFAVVAGVVLSPLARRRSEALEPGLSLARGLVLRLSTVLPRCIRR